VTLKEKERRKDLKIITMSWPDRFGFPIFNSVDWEMRERQREMVADRRQRKGGVRRAKKQQMEKGTGKEKERKGLSKWI